MRGHLHFSFLLLTDGKVLDPVEGNRNARHAEISCKMNPAFPAEFFPLDFIAAGIGHGHGKVLLHAGSALETAALAAHGREKKERDEDKTSQDCPVFHENGSFRPELHS